MGNHGPALSRTSGPNVVYPMLVAPAAISKGRARRQAARFLGRGVPDPIALVVILTAMNVNASV